MILSADKLNQHSPYHLTQINDMAFGFVTDQQIRYNVGFYPDKFFMGEGAYHFFIDNSEHEHGTYDPKILDVVTIILEEFFSQEPTVMLYICDPTDKRQAARDRLYHLWFYDYARNHEMTLFSDSVTFKEIKYYTGILMRHDHPMHDIILTSYQEFLKHVPERFTIREK
ncbi:MAG: hypothetical protein IJ249_01925 [Paludibacteraceae bacterium]|jgi:hypothetical protein|nr:hypothetical protein [Paludibacteraceae bacterium]MBQ8482560.1 hypothetical protein [Alphaproteobacteria bacterium]